MMRSLETLERYSRQLLLPHIGVHGQRKLSNSVVAVVGVGALGSHAVDLLIRAGVGKLILIDRDLVELHNLQRQCLYSEKDVGKAKVYCAQTAVLAVNSSISVEAHLVDLDFTNIERVFRGVDLIIDGTDNLSTRFLLNEYSVKHRIPWVYAGVVGVEGSVIFFSGSSQAFCFRCLFREAQQLGTCDTLGVLNSAVSVVAGLQVTEALKYLVGKKTLSGVLRYHALHGRLEQYAVHRHKQCECCVRKEFPYLLGVKGENVVRLCGQGIYQLKGKAFDLKRLKQQLRKQLSKGEKKETLVDLGYCLKFRMLTVFKDGRVLISAKDETAAKSLYDRYLG